LTSKISLLWVSQWSSQIASADDVTLQKKVHWDSNLESVREFYAHEPQQNDGPPDEPLSTQINRNRVNVTVDPDYQELKRNRPKTTYSPNERSLHALQANIRMKSEAAEEEFVQEYGSKTPYSRAHYHELALKTATQHLETATHDLAVLEAKKQTFIFRKPDPNRPPRPQEEVEAETHAQAKIAIEIQEAKKFVLFNQESKKFHEQELEHLKLAPN
jgi:hypothetical protein